MRRPNRSAPLRLPTEKGPAGSLQTQWRSLSRGCAAGKPVCIAGAVSCERRISSRRHKKEELSPPGDADRLRRDFHGAPDMTDILLFLHILLFVFSFAFTAGISILLGRVAGKADPATIHAAFGAARPLSMAGGIGWVLTAPVGGALAGALHLSLDGAL